MMLERWQNDKEFKNKMSDNLKNRWETDKYFKELMSNLLQKRWQDDDFRDKMSQVAKEVRQKQFEKSMEDLNISFKGKTLINIKDFYLYDNIPGVWSLWGVNRHTGNFECLTLGQTTDLNRELQWTLRVLTNDKLQELESKAPGCTGRWYIIQRDYENFSFEIVCANESNQTKREIIEMIEASNTNAKFWRPSLSQCSKTFKEKVEDFIYKF